jgi:hypothetical protein
VVIVQAEAGPDGETTYGVIASAGIRKVLARELTKIKTFAGLEKEATEAKED